MADAAHISLCIDGWDVEGRGDNLDDALFAIAQDCAKDAASQEQLAAKLRAAAARFLAMRDVKP